MLRTYAALPFAVLGLLLASHTHHRHHRAHHRHGCNTRACDRRIDRLYARLHRPPAPRWAIPEYVVICESKGVNLAPNSAGAAGYYQIIPSTWAAYGGSPPDDASQHSKAEQDAVAARIWREGGPSQWVCA